LHSTKAFLSILGSRKLRVFYTFVNHGLCHSEHLQP
jgi:hypothetical protein